MKKLLLLAACISSIGAIAQPKWVSTSPQNKKVVLEEFTGIHCGYCPDGHRIANELVAANPGKVFLVNIHSGSYAVPSGTEPDFRTTEGTAIDGQAGITGYPSGSVSRSDAPWGQSRNLWTAKAATLLGQSSPVNVAVKAVVDMVSRKCTTEVEVYYTAAGTGTKNYLTVMLTEDGILGPQSDYGNYNPTNWVGTQYLHNHVLRQFISGNGAFGETIDTISSGYYMYKKYITDIPTTYKNTSVSLPKLNVIAFVAQANNNILSADESPVVDPSLQTDLGLTDHTVKPTLCGTSITPIVDVINNKPTPVGSFYVYATVNGTKYAKKVTSVLSMGQSTTVTFAAIPFTVGGTFDVKIGSIDSIKAATNGNILYDLTSANDNVFVNGFSFIDAAVPPGKVWCGFETSYNTGIDLSQNPNATVPATTPAYGHWSAKALRMALHSSWGVAGKPVTVLMGKTDLSTISNPGLQYAYAYSDDNLGGTPPIVSVQVSKDCGATWNIVNTTTAIQTGLPATTGNWYVPTTTSYNTVKVDLSAYKNDKIVTKISVTPGTTGNAFYLDEVSFNTFSALGVKEVSNNSGFGIYPNPASGNFNLKLENNTTANYTIIDLSGKTVQTGTVTKETNVDCSELTNGVYMVEVVSEGKTATQKLVIAK